MCPTACGQAGTLKNMNAQDVSNTLAALVLLRDSVPEVDALLSQHKFVMNAVKRSTHRFPEMNDADLHLAVPFVVWACAKVGIRNDELLTSVSQLFGSRKKCSKLTDWSICALHWSHKVLDPEKRFKDFNRTLETVIRNRGLSESDACQCLGGARALVKTLGHAELTGTAKALACLSSSMCSGSILEAMIFASEYLHEERPGMQVAADPRREQIPPKGDLPGTTGIRFYLSLVPEQADMIFSQSTNPGVAATELAEKMTQRNLVTLSGMGEHAISMALKAVIIARTRLKLEEQDALLVAPSMQAAQLHPPETEMHPEVTPESLEDRSMTLELEALDALGIADAQAEKPETVGQGWDLDVASAPKGPKTTRFWTPWRAEAKPEECAVQAVVLDRLTSPEPLESKHGSTPGAHGYGEGVWMIPFA
eukprot:s1089_g10.t1